MCSRGQNIPTVRGHRGGGEKGCRITYFITRKTSALSSGRFELLNGLSILRSQLSTQNPMKLSSERRDISDFFFLWQFVARGNSPGNLDTAVPIPSKSPSSSIDFCKLHEHETLHCAYTFYTSLPHRTRTTEGAALRFSANTFAFCSPFLPSHPYRTIGPEGNA